MANQKLLDRVHSEIRRRNYSYRTEQAYSQWIIRFIKFHRLCHPLELNEEDVVAFLNWLAIDQNVAASTQNQALCAIVFLYNEVLNRPLNRLNQLKRAKEYEKTGRFAAVWCRTAPFGMPPAQNPGYRFRL